MTIRIISLIVAFLVAITVIAIMEVIVLFMDLYDEEMRDKENEYNNKV